ncbi:amidohydrolase [candidate division KSB1 bacterium]|nr:amidohydrolase [candidate division KSB1 bacterium]NIR68543.1 amidohydrolase [candidate division KSB1 bacterium]NIS27109.1 amidohydrolase [candidate division KSB1 bacterium]NIT73994.1 amidohydrolase [candidate division KSB1 bacterium]NIU27853.1 amidohydrolase [candidate division KSB1 bacterium]
METKLKRQPFLALVSVVLTLASCSTQEEAADLVFHNGTVWTVDAQNPTAEAVAIKDGAFMAVGSDEDIVKLRDANTQTIDLKGKFVVPGFNDNHVHFASAARFLEFNIMKVSTQEEFVNRVREVVEALPADEWILGGYWGAYDAWAPGSSGDQSREPFTPNVDLVEEITADHPMFIWKFDRSEFIANATALKAVGLDPENPQARDLQIFQYRKSNGLTVLRGDGVRPLFESKIPKTFSHERRLQQTRRALAEIRKHGVTNISDMSDDEQLQIYRELHEAGDLTVRVHFRYPLERWRELADQGIQIGSGDPWIRLGSLKGHIDGIMGNSTARFFEPYSHDPDNRGRWRKLMVDDEGNFVEGKFLKYMLDADKAGLQLTVHAIGDEANHLLLNYLEELNRQNGKKDRRFRLVHAQVIAPDDFKRLGELDVIAEVQPFHLSDDMRWMEERIGYERCKGAYAFQRIIDSGATLCFGTDWPGTAAAEYPINPMLGMYAAVTRQTTTGQPEGGWFPEERISIEEAIKAYTYHTAYANFEEDIKGSITAGKLADMTVLSRNLLEIPPEEILETDVLYTVVDGKIVYERL